MAKNKRRGTRTPTTRTKSRQANRSSFMSKMLQPKAFLLLILVIGGAVLVIGSDYALSSYSMGKWSFNVTGNSVEIDNQPLDTMSSSLSITDSNLAFAVNKDLTTGVTIDREGTGYSPINVGFASWRSIYKVGGVDTVGAIGDAQIYSQGSSGDRITYQYKLLMEIVLRTAMKNDTVTSTTLAMTGGNVVDTELPSIASQEIVMVFDYAAVKGSAYTDADIVITSIAKYGSVIGAIYYQTPTRIITQTLATAVEPYVDSPNIAPIYPDISLIGLESTPDGTGTAGQFVVTLTLAPGVVRYNDAWLARNVEIAFDIEYDITIQTDAYAQARITIPNIRADPRPYIPQIVSDNTGMIITVVAIFVIIIITVLLFGRKKGHLKIRPSIPRRNKKEKNVLSEAQEKAYAKLMGGTSSSVASDYKKDKIGSYEV
jgi:hypothetical protein